ncbi:MAG: DUF3311 domain-containing protein [Nocardioidaceae bacterium]
MSANAPTRSRPPNRILLIPAGVLLAVAIVVPLLVSTYAKATPDLDGIPFFFWYQFLLIPIAAVLTVSAYLLVERHDRPRPVDPSDEDAA